MVRKEKKEFDPMLADWEDVGKYFDNEDTNKQHTHKITVVNQTLQKQTQESLDYLILQ